MAIIKQILVISGIMIILFSCQKSSENSSSDNKENSIVPPIIEDDLDPISNPSADSENNNNGYNEKEVAIYSQDFEGIGISDDWEMIDFGILSYQNKSLYTLDQKLLFSIQWTGRTRKLLADKLNIERKDFTKNMANEFCEPKLEVGKEKVYLTSQLGNHLAELDGDLSQCGISGTEPASVSLTSFVPTKIGYKYKLKLRYIMRSYSQMNAKSYRHLVVNFAGERAKFNPVFDKFNDVEVEVLATSKYSRIVLTDTGIPDSFGVLIDDVKVYEGEKSPALDQCSEYFQVGSSGHRKCLKGELSSDEICDFSNPSKLHIKTKTYHKISSQRRNILNLFNSEGIIDNKVNFLSLGLKGQVKMSCTVAGHLGLFDIYQKTLMLQEVSWGNVDCNSYPEVAKVMVNLQNCENEQLNNKNIVVDLIKTKNSLKFTFDSDSQGRSFKGCKMRYILIKDISPNGASKDGVDLNSFKLE